MKKFFIYLLFISLILPIYPAVSGVRSAAEEAPSAPRNIQENRQSLQKLYAEIPDLNNPEAVRKYLQKRLKIVTGADISPDEMLSPSATSIVDPEEQKQKQQAAMSAYERIYQESMRRSEGSGTINEGLELDGTFYRLKEDTAQPQAFVPDFPYVTVKLSDNKEILAPAEEHIAYLLTTFNVEATGLLRITEEFIFVSNNESFPAGFFRILPKYAYSQSGERRRLDLALDSVTVNGDAYPYKITEIGNYLYIEPENPLDLPSGIHTYKFNYIVDRMIWFNDNFDEFYWDITAKTLRNVVGSANALVILPTGKTFLAQNAVISKKQGLDAERVTIAALAPNSLGFADTEALDVGEDMHIFITLEKDTILPPDFAKRYFWLLQDHGAVIFALLALAAVYFSYKISLAQIRRNQDKTRATLKKTPAVFRLVNSNVFDSRSLGAEILNLCAKNILELQPKNNGAVLIKKTDNLQSLSKTERQLVRILFPGTDTALPSTAESALKITRAYQYLKLAVYRRFEMYKLKLNGLYLVFSFAMVICGMAGAAALSVNPPHTFGVALGCMLLMLPNIVFYFIKLKNKYADLALKIFAAAAILSVGAWLAVYTSNLYTVLMIISLIMICRYYRLFSRRNGLLRNKIKETEEYKSYLQKNTSLAQNSRDFNSRMPYIYAFDLEQKYPDTEIFKLINCILTSTAGKPAKD